MTYCTANSAGYKHIMGNQEFGKNIKMGKICPEAWK
jgi:hypothetical protein